MTVYLSRAASNHGPWTEHSAGVVWFLGNASHKETVYCSCLCPSVLRAWFCPTKPLGVLPGFQVSGFGLLLRVVGTELWDVPLL